MKSYWIQKRENREWEQTLLFSFSSFFIIIIIIIISLFNSKNHNTSTHLYYHLISSPLDSILFEWMKRKEISHSKVSLKDWWPVKIIRVMNNSPWEWSTHQYHFTIKQPFHLILIWKWILFLFLSLQWLQFNNLIMIIFSNYSFSLSNPTITLFSYKLSQLKWILTSLLSLLLSFSSLSFWFWKKWYRIEENHFNKHSWIIFQRITFQRKERMESERILFHFILQFS